MDRRSRLRSVAVLLATGVVVWGVARCLFGGAPEAGPDESARWTVLSGARGWTLAPARAATFARGPGGKNDLYLAWVRPGPDGRPTWLSGVTNVTRSPSVHERQLLAAPGRIAFAAAEGEEDEATSVEVILLDQPVSRSGDGWTLARRAAAALTDLELWGQLRAPRRIRVDLHHPARHADLAWRGGDLTIVTDRGELVLELPRGTLARGTALAGLSEPEQGCPDLFRWGVDKLRYGRIVGPERLQRLEEIYLDVSDATAGVAGELVASGDSEAVARRLGPIVPASRDEGAWPPPPLDPLIEPRIEGEGEWRERDDAFVTRPDGVPPLFHSTFLRTEPDRPRTSRVFITVWDPAWLELDWIAGTMEPRSTHGLVGTGRVPPEDLERLVAGFNGGFQAVDGAFGMRTRAGRFLPPVPYGATVARLDDGRLGLGTWPAALPAEVEPVAYRQNLTALVERGEVNPWGRRFWGGVPAELTDTARTDRTGLCLTTDGLLAYFWGQRVTVSGLAQAMRAGRCDYGLLLDINFSNTVFETYRIARAGKLPPVGRPLDPEWEREGPVDGRPDLAYRVQAMAPGMTRVGFPRYIRTELRDFFYLTLRREALGPPAAVPCSATAVPEEGTVPPRAWRCVLEDGVSRELVALDLRRVELSLAEAGTEESSWLAWPVADGAGGTGNLALVLRRGRHGGTSASIIGAADAAEVRDALVVGGWSLADADGSAALPATIPGTVAAVAPGGTLVLVETVLERATDVWPRLRASGFEQAIFVPRGERTLGAAPDPSPLAVRIFTDTEPVPPRVWTRVHRQAQELIDAQGLTRGYVQIRDYRERDRGER
jgi:hypothetical protein